MTKKAMRKIIHSENFSEAEVKGVISLYNELVPGDDTRTIDVKMIIKEAFPKFEETIGKKEFYKVKQYFGIGCKPNVKYANEIKYLVARLRTIENAQYYIVGYKALIKKLAEKLCNAPEDMNELEKAKIMRMFFIIFANNEIFLEDYVWRVFPDGKSDVVFSEEKALSNNKLIFRPEELFNIFAMKVKYTDGYYYDMMVNYFKRMYHVSRNQYKHELAEILEFAELNYDGKNFVSVNRCMQGATFAKIRNLKQRIHKVRGAYPMELFCNKKMIDEKIDITDLYVIYKTLSMYPWEKEAKTKNEEYRTLSGSRFVDKQQAYYEVLDGCLIADKAEAERWVALFEYVAEHELVLSTEVDGNGGVLAEPKFYNAGVLFAALKYAREMAYINETTKVIKDFEVVNKLLALEGAEEKFLKLKRNEVKMEDMKVLLGIDEDNPLIKSVIKFALDNGYAETEADIDVTLVENVFIPRNEENIKKFSNGEINDSELEKRIGFESEFAEAYFNTSKIDIKKVEARLLHIKQCGKKDQIRKSKLLVSLYCYIVKNNIKCGTKNKTVKRNKGLKPEILEKLIS